MSTGMEDYKPVQMIAEAEPRVAEGIRKASSMTLGATVLLSLAEQIENTPHDVVESGQQLIVDVGSLIAPLEAESLAEAAEALRQSTEDIQAAAGFEAGIAQAAKENIIYLETRLADNTAA